MRDRASGNNIAVQFIIKVLHTNILYIGCFSQTLDLIGDKIYILALTDFMLSWLKSKNTLERMHFYKSKNAFTKNTFTKAKMLWSESILQKQKCLGANKLVGRSKATVLQGGSLSGNA